MRLLLTIILASLPLSAATVTKTVNLNFESTYAPALIAYLEANFLAEADTDLNGTVSQAEALAWFESKAQNVATTFVHRAVDWAETNSPASLPVTHQTALTGKAAADAALNAEKAKAQP